MASGFKLSAHTAIAPHNITSSPSTTHSSALGHMDPFNLARFLPQIQASSSAPSSGPGVPAPNLANHLLNPFFGQVRISPTTTLVDSHQLGLGACNADVLSASFDPSLFTSATSAMSDLMSRLAKHDMMPESSCTDLRADQHCTSTTTAESTQLSPLSDAPSSSASVNTPIAAPPLFKEEPKPVGNANTFNFLSTALNTLVPADNDSLNCPSSSDDNAGSSNGGDPIKGVLLCQVCSDRASGFHYGVTSCEGCKGFFRRSIQQKIQYRGCTKGQRCAIVRNNRNRCQDCRLRKCISVGMSRDAVRFGRVPKREKVKMVEEMQRATLRSRMDILTVELEDGKALMNSILMSFADFGSALQHEINRDHNVDSTKLFVVNSADMLPVVHAVVNFSKGVRGFGQLFHQDRVQLLKSSFFQILLIRLSCMRDMSNQLLDASSIPRHLFLDDEDKSEAAILLRNSIVEFVQRFRIIQMDDNGLAFFTALVMCQCQSDLGTSTHMNQGSLVKLLQEKMWWALQTALFQHLDPIVGPLLAQSIFAALTDLKTLNGMYDEQCKQIRCFVPLPTESVQTSASMSYGATELPPMSLWPEGAALKQTRAASPPPSFRKEECGGQSAIAQLLEKPSVVFSKSSRPAVQAPPDEEQPLNLCLRDNQPY